MTRARTLGLCPFRARRKSLGSVPRGGRLERAASSPHRGDDDEGETAAGDDGGDGWAWAEPAEPAAAATPAAAPAAVVPETSPRAVRAIDDWSDAGFDDVDDLLERARR